jgi:hypothetical protein
MVDATYPLRRRFALLTLRNRLGVLNSLKAQGIGFGHPAYGMALEAYYDAKFALIGLRCPHYA